MKAKDKITETVKEIKESCDNYLMYDEDPVYERKMIDSIIDGARELVMIQLQKTSEEESKCL